MNTSVLKVLHSFTIRANGRSVAATLVLAAMISLTILPGYSSNQARAFTAHHSQIQAQALNVTPSYDRDHAVTQIMSSRGGSLTTTGADGTSFTLYVPVDGFLSAARVTMTPVTAIGELPLSGALAAAVQLEPAGLRLLNFATLVIEPPQVVSPDLETAFSWDESGSDFHLYSLQLPSRIQRENSGGSGQQLNPRGLVFKLLHFSGYGVGSGTDADRAAQQQQPPSYSEARFEQRFEAISGRERRRQLASVPTDAAIDASIQSAADEGEYHEDAEWVAEVDELQRDSYNNEVKPAMNAALASRDDHQLQCALLKARIWQRRTLLHGMHGKFYDKAERARLKFNRQALEIVADNAGRRCSENKPEEIAILLFMAHEQAVLGFDDSKTLKNLEKCAKFELEFDSEIDIVGPAETTKTHLHAKVPIRMKIDASGQNVEGVGPLEYFIFQFIPAGSCTATATTQDSALVVTNFGIDLNSRQIGDCQTVTSSFEILSVDMEPGQPTELVTMICPKPPAGVGTFPLPPSSNWFLFFAALHQDEQGGGGYQIASWEKGGGALVARRTYSRDQSFGPAAVTERTAMNIWHRPE